MKVIFLDVDGVLNNPNTRSRSPEGWRGVSKELVDRLKRIISVTGAKVVLTSTWKHSSNVELEYLYKKLGKKAKPIDKTEDPYDKDSYRGAGIRNYLKSHKEITEFVILDDFDFDFVIHDLHTHHVWTDSDTGITDEDVEKAIDVLNGNLIPEEEHYDMQNNQNIWGYHR